MTEVTKIHCFTCHEENDMRIYPLTSLSENGEVIVVEGVFWAQCSKCHGTTTVEKGEGGWAPCREVDMSHYIPSYCSKHEISHFGVKCPFCIEKGLD